METANPAVAHTTRAVEQIEVSVGLPSVVVDGLVTAQRAQHERLPRAAASQIPRAPVVQRHPGYPALKMALEWPVTLVLCVIAAPIVLAMVLLVKLTSPGPALYRQARLGRCGRVYDMLKIRSMTHNCELKTGAIWSGPHDRRVTRVGRFLRDTHLDELPQLWNVLRGEMSLIGPRPERPEMVLRIERVLPHHRDRLLVRPGLTGFAQIQHTADFSLDHVRRKLNYDLYYVEHMSLWLDLRIAVGTFFYFMGMTLRAIGKMTVRSHGRVVEEVIETEAPIDEDDDLVVTR